MRNHIKHLLCAGLAGLAAFSSHAQLYSNAVVALHPVAYYPLDETIQPPDPVTTLITNYGTDSGLSMNITADVVFGEPGALAAEPSDSSDYFNGGIAYGSTSYDAALGNSPPFSIEGWFLCDNTTATKCPTSDFDANSPRSGWLIYMDIANAGQYTFRAYNQNGTTPSLSFNIGAPGSINQGQWYQLTVVVDVSGGATNVSGYIDGVLASGPTPLTSYVPNDGGDGGLSVGARSDGGFGFEGDIDELAYYTNALSAATVLSHYQTGTNTSPATPYSQLVLQENPLAYYRFNESTPPLVNPYPVPLPIAHNYGSLGAEAEGYYSVGSQPGGVPGPTNAGLNNLPALELNPLDVESTTTAGPGVWCAPFSPDEFNETNALSVAFWVEASTNAPAYFETVMGRGDRSWRFDLDQSGNPHWAAAPNGDVVGPTPLLDGQWHYWAGVYDPVAQQGTLYIDGAAVASAGWTSLSADTSTGYPLLIGGAPDYFNGARNFSGNIAQVAIFTNALTQPQVNSLYAAAGAPPSAAVLTSGATNDEGATVEIQGSAGGSSPLSLQWYQIDNSATTSPVPGATNQTLDLTNVPFADSGFQFYLVASNSFGVATSGIVTLQIIQGPPNLETDITPPLSELPVGVADQFSVSVTGSQPFFYHWFLNSTLVPGATNSTFPFTVLPGSNTYSATISNAFGPINSSEAVVIGLTTAPVVVTFGSGADWSTNGNLGPGAPVPAFVPSGLQLTDGNNGEVTSAFYVVPQYIEGFVASFTYTETNGSAPLADGTTFTVQNSPEGTNILGDGGGDLGYYGIPNSIAFEINIYSSANGGVGLAYGVNGATPDSPIPTPPYISSSPVNVASGDPIDVRIYFANGLMTVNLADTVTGAMYHGSHMFGDLIPILGGASGYVGFTGATGGLNSGQIVSNFEFSSTTSPTLSITSSNQTAMITWPVSVSTLFKLQESTNVAGPYINVTTTPTVVNGENEITVPESSSTGFFRLFVQ